MCSLIFLFYFYEFLLRKHLFNFNTDSVYVSFIILVHFIQNLSLYKFYSYKIHFTVNIQTYITQESYITPHTHKTKIPLITHNIFNNLPKHTNFSKNLVIVYVLYHQTICHCVITVKYKHHRLPLVTSLIPIQSFVSYYCTVPLSLLPSFFHKYNSLT